MINEELNNTNTPTEPIDSVGVRYCTIEEVEVLIDVNIPDDAHNDIINRAIDNGVSRIHTRLRANRVPLPDPQEYSSTIRTVNIYYAICDLYSSLFNGTDWEIESNHWCKTATELLDDYIQAYENTCAEDLEQYSTSGHHNSLTYRERRRHGFRNTRNY